MTETIKLKMAPFAAIVASAVLAVMMALPVGATQPTRGMVITDNNLDLQIGDRYGDWNCVIVDLNQEVDVETDQTNIGTSIGGDSNSMAGNLLVDDENTATSGSTGGDSNLNQTNDSETTVTQTVQLDCSTNTTTNNTTNNHYTTNQVTGAVAGTQTGRGAGMVAGSTYVAANTSATNESGSAWGVNGGRGAGVQVAATPVGGVGAGAGGAVAASSAPAIFGLGASLSAIAAARKLRKLEE